LPRGFKPSRNGWMNLRDHPTVFYYGNHVGFTLHATAVGVRVRAYGHYI
jgi:hypothetical protein